ncbi:hypothetical protein SASPL_132918 [Salvia splendens]|uniref:Uncharacterized protein n=1 Tax=Salvia splendens TaxID=180675 RepID=A0A8X8ZHU1_SALSN|nr:hypothetical protein SASPL_132915 [Salvia splendens]KAG6405329.1 hypothetical protein SASPL_132918 [Salvia splendens]
MSTFAMHHTLLNCRAEVCKALEISESQCELSMGMSGDFEQAIEMGSTSAAAAVGTKRKAEVVRKVAAKKHVKKAASPVKAKQPKSIKSPAAKRARRAAAL